jgi:predicted small secreted protein
MFYVRRCASFNGQRLMRHEVGSKKHPPLSAPHADYCVPGLCSVIISVSGTRQGDKEKKRTCHAILMVVAVLAALSIILGACNYNWGACGDINSFIPAKSIVTCMKAHVACIYVRYV